MASIYKSDNIDIESETLRRPLLSDNISILTYMAKFEVRDKVMEIQKRYLMTCAMLNRLILVVKRVIAKIVPLPVKNLVMSENGVPDDARTIGFNMCRDSIGGVWANIQEHEFQIKPLR